MNLLRALLVLSLVSATLSCGGSSKEDPVALCKQGCNKAVELCADDLGGLTPAQAKALCEGICTSQVGGNGMTCTNESAIIAAYKTCQTKTTCDEYTACGESIPECQGGSTGTGGASGTGGRSGTGGSSGGGTGGRSGTGGSSGGGASGTGACAEVLACCNASTNATIKAACLAQYDSIVTAGDANCAMILPTLKTSVCP